MSDNQGMHITLRIWRQKSDETSGRFVDYPLDGASEDMSFLEVLDVLNEKLARDGEDPVAFDSDCREGICGSCGSVIQGIAHGPLTETASCQLYMRHFKDGDLIMVEPFRAQSFRIIKDLVVDRSALDRILSSRGHISVQTGSAPDANSVQIQKHRADEAFDYATCIGCGACVAACPNASASLFTAAKVAHLALLPQGRPEAKERVRAMVDRMDEEGFGNCSNHGECEAVCPKGISIRSIALMRREYLKSLG